MAARVHRGPHPVPVPGGCGVRGRQGRAVRAHHRPGAAGPAGRGGHRPGSTPRPPKPNASPRPRPATSTSGSATQASRAGSVSTATWTWPTPWTWRPRSPRTPTSNWPWARPTPSTSAAPSPPATWPAPSRPSTWQTHPTQPHQPTQPTQVVLHVHLEHAAVLGAGGLARLQEVSGPVTAAQVREWCANPGRTGHRPAGARPRRTPPCRLLRGLRPAQAPDPAPRPHLRVPVLLPPRRAVRLRPPRPARPRPRRRRPDLHLQPGPRAVGATTAPRPPAAGPT